MATIAGGVVAGLGVLASLAWMGQAVAAFRYRKRVAWLADLPDGPPEGGWPALAVIFAARNEAEASAQRLADLLVAEMIWDDEGNDD